MSVLPGLPFNREFAERGDSLLFHYLHYPGGKTLKILEAHRFSPTTKYPWCGMLEYEEFVRFDDTGDASAYGAVVRMAPKKRTVWVVLYGEIGDIKPRSETFINESQARAWANKIRPPFTFLSIGPHEITE